MCTLARNIWREHYLLTILKMDTNFLDSDMLQSTNRMTIFVFSSPMHYRLVVGTNERFLGPFPRLSFARIRPTALLDHFDFILVHSFRWNERFLGPLPRILPRILCAYTSDGAS
jgi:hypothetical protein